MLAFFRKYRPIIIFIALVVLVLVLTGTSIYFYKKAHRLSVGSSASQAEVQSLIKEIGKIMVLPQGEVPTIATVSDPEKLKDQEFFVDAVSGYKVLIYATAKKAILYDPKSKKIVNVAPVNIGSEASAGTQ